MTNNHKNYLSATRTLTILPQIIGKLDGLATLEEMQKIYEMCICILDTEFQISLIFDIQEYIKKLSIKYNFDESFIGRFSIAISTDDELLNNYHRNYVFSLDLICILASDIVQNMSMTQQYIDDDKIQDEEATKEDDFICSKMTKEEHDESTRLHGLLSSGPMSLNVNIRNLSAFNNQMREKYVNYK